MQDQSNVAIGRFDKSFLVHMIKDFFGVLVLVTILEFAIKAGGVYWDYVSNGEDQAEFVANELAENVISIMTNEGGPVAARTMYPILEQNWEDLGYQIAIVPSAVTTTSIEESFGFTPMGIPEERLSVGKHKASIVNIRAGE